MAIALALSALPVGLAADLTLEDGVVVKFGPEARLVVRDRIVPGQGLVFTSLKDDSAGGPAGATPQTPQLGDWRGLRLEKSAAAFGALTLSDLTIRYAGAAEEGGEAGAALAVRGWSPTLRYLQLTDSSVGLRVLEGAAPHITGASFLNNLTGIEADSDSAPSIDGSQFAGNAVLAIDNQTPATVIQATGNWWGHPSGPRESIANPEGLGDAVSLGVDFSDFLGLAPLIRPTVRLAEPAPYFEHSPVLLDLACVNATEYRLAETSDLANLPFQALPQGRARVPFTASAGDGRKPVHVEFRDAGGATATATLAGGVPIDTRAPAVTLIHPAAGSLIRQPIDVEATAFDALGITELRFYLNDQPIATRTVPPYAFHWDTGASPDGTYTLRAVASDGAGRLGEHGVAVTLSRAPPPPDTDGPELTGLRVDGAPLADGTTLVHSGTLTFSAADRSGIARVDLLLDGLAVAAATGGGSVYTAVLDLGGVANGGHVLALHAVDSLGNASTTNVSVTVAHAPPAAPVLSQPADGLVTRQTTVQVVGSAQPGHAVQIRVNGQPAGPALAAGGDGRFSASVTLAPGTHHIQATASDAHGTGPASNSLSVTVDTSVPAGPGHLTATAQAAGQVRLAWERSTDPRAVGYDLYRAAAAFTDIGQASRVNASPLTATRYDDLPWHDGPWTYRVVAVNAAGTPSEPSNPATARSDSTAPRALSIVYAPQGRVDPATGRVGQGRVDLTLTLSEAAAAVPYLAIVPQNGIPRTVDLAPAGEAAYTGSFVVDTDTPSGVANALFSARDAVGNRGTEIDAGTTLAIDTAGPALSGIALDPDSPIENEGGTPVEAVFTLTEPPKSAPEITVRLSGAGREPLAVTDLAADDPTTWRGRFALPADAGAAGPETLSFGFRASDAMDNLSTRVLASNRFQVYQGALPPPWRCPTPSRPRPVRAAGWRWTGRPWRTRPVISCTARLPASPAWNPWTGPSPPGSSTPPPATACTATPSPRCGKPRAGRRFPARARPPRSRPEPRRPARRGNWPCSSPARASSPPGCRRPRATSPATASIAPPARAFPTWPDSRPSGPASRNPRPSTPRPRPPRELTRSRPWTPPATSRRRPPRPTSTPACCRSRSSPSSGSARSRRACRGPCPAARWRVTGSMPTSATAPARR